DLRVWAVLLPVVITGGVYLWKPSVNPDHIWAIRRFLPVILPGLALGIAYTIHFASRARRQSIRWMGIALAILSLVVVVGRIPATIGLHEFEDAVGDFQELCEAARGDAVLVVDSRPDGFVPRLVQSVRSYCGVPAAGVQDADRLDDILMSL